MKLKTKHQVRNSVMTGDALTSICECNEHGWMRDRADPHARERALVIARQDPPPGVSTEEAIAELRDVLYSMGDTCPECPPD